MTKPEINVEQIKSILDKTWNKAFINWDNGNFFKDHVILDNTDLILNVYAAKASYMIHEYKQGWMLSWMLCTESYINATKFIFEPNSFEESFYAFTKKYFSGGKTTACKHNVELAVERIHGGILELTDAVIKNKSINGGHLIRVGYELKKI